MYLSRFNYESKIKLLKYFGWDKIRTHDLPNQLILSYKQRRLGDTIFQFSSDLLPLAITEKGHELRNEMKRFKNLSFNKIVLKLRFTLPFLR